jgi:DNA helicase II / ATP-dependent DNA helicase PcrA
LSQFRNIAKRISISFPSEVLNIFLADFYSDYLKEKYPNFRDRMLDARQLINLADQYAKIGSFLDDIILDSSLGAKGESDETDETVTLSTIHQSKGLEWKTVFLISVAEDRFPLSRACADGALEEERRLFYVACSRCKKGLYLTVPMQDSSFWGGSQLLKDSIFVEELPENCYEEWEIREEYDSE